MNNEIKISLSLESASFDQVASDLKLYLESPTKRTLQIIKRFLSGCDSASKFVSLDSDAGPASGTGEHRVVLKPSDSLRELMTALGAGKLQGV